MSAPRYLIDTNVFIGLEDDHEVSSDFSSLLSLAGKHDVGVFIHEAALDDIARDTNAERRRVSLSKVKKFQAIAKVRNLSPEYLARYFGELKKPNDVVDATLLHALSLDVADFLVTEDRGLHERARRSAPEISRRVLFVADAVSLLKTTYEPVDVSIRYVEEVVAHSIPLHDDIFNSLRQGYPGFDAWWREKCVKQMRKCWIVDDGGLAGLIVRKDESAQDTDSRTPARKILKICTFKVRPEKRGIKLGELLLKKALWFAQHNSYDLIYLTTFPDQGPLIELLEYYGFVVTHVSQAGELMYEKVLSRQKLQRVAGENLFELARIRYPRFYTGSEVEAYGIPIKEAYHDELFPELKERLQSDLFEALGIEGRPKRPGNTIRKVYLCRAQAMIRQPGSLLFFYKGRSNHPPSQAITTVGIFEDMSFARSTADLMRLAGGRSVYSERQLEEWKSSADRPTKVINYLLAGYFEPAVRLRDLQAFGVIGPHPPQSIFRIGRSGLEGLLSRLQLGFEV